MRKKTKRWLAALMAAFLCMGAAELTMPMTVMAAQNSETMTVTTTQRCSIWNAPVTAEENRVKYVDAGYQITVYPEVIQSELGDGKTFYRTVRGSYVLCRCVEGAIGNGAGTIAAGGAANGDNVAVLLPIPPMPEPSVLAGRTGVRWERRDYFMMGSYTGCSIHEYDTSGNRIKTTEYNSDGSITAYTVYDYDAMGNNIKYTEYEADGMTVKLLCIREYDAQGNEVKTVQYNVSEPELELWKFTVGVSEYEYDAFGNAVKRWVTKYAHEHNGIILSLFDECMEGHDVRYSDGSQFKVKGIATAYNADGTMRASCVHKYEFDAAGRRISDTETVYDADGTKLASRVFKDEYNMSGDGGVMLYDASGVPVKAYGARYYELAEIFDEIGQRFGPFNIVN